MGRSQIWDGSKWVDMTGGSSGGGVTSHDELTGVTDSQHHAKYTDAEARSAVVGLYLPLTGGSLTGDLLMEGTSQITIPRFGSSSDVAIAIGDTASTRGVGMWSTSTNFIMRFFNGATEWGQFSISENFLQYGTNVKNPAILVGNVQTKIYGNGVSYPDCTIGGGTDNDIGFRWVGGNSVYVTVDNVVALLAASSSDRRLKANETPVSDALSMILDMPPLYTYNGVGMDGEIFLDSVQYGQMADEMEQVFPELVTGDGEDTEEGNPTYQTIDYVAIVPLLVGAVRELAEEVRRYNVVQTR